MKIAFVSICGYPWGGSEELWSLAAKEALNNHHKVLISVFNWPEQHYRVKELIHMGATAIFRRRFFPSFIERSKKHSRNLFRSKNEKSTYHDYLLDFNPSHILFSLAGGDEIAIDDSDLMVFIRQVSIPFSVMYHSVTPGHVYSREIVQNMGEVIDKSCYSFFSSNMQAEMYRDQLQHDIPNAHVLNHPVRDISFQPLPEGAHDTVHMCMIGSLVKRWKGQDLAINVLSDEKWKKRKWVLDVYGTGEDLAELKTLATISGITERVRFLGYERDINRVLGGYHLVLIPSRQDTGPIILFESMKAGRVVVGTYMGAMPDYIEDGTTGFISETFDQKGYGAAMERAWASMTNWPAIGQSASDKIKTQFDPMPEKTLLRFLEESYAGHA